MDDIIAGICVIALVELPVGGFYMEDIIECYGVGILQILGGICATAIWFAMFQQDGILRQMVLQYLHGICA